MDYSELCLSNVGKVKVIFAKKPPVFGRISISRTHIAFLSDKNNFEILILNQSIDSLESKSYQNTTSSGQVLTGGLMTVKCKDLRIYNFEIFSNENFTKIAQILNVLTRVLEKDSRSLEGAYYFKPNFPILENGYELFRTSTEFAKLLKTGEWRISTVNQGYKVCATYGELLIVPATVDDTTIMSAARFRENGRFPLMCYRHSNGAVLCRGSQPLTGLLKRSKQDELLLNKMLTNTKGIIIDTRSYAFANQCKARFGGGFETDSSYPQWKRSHQNFDKISACLLLESFSKLIEACNDVNCSTDKWLSRLENCGWLTLVSNLLNAACVAAQCIDKESSSVFVHGSTGRDATLIVTSLTQIILNPDCRLYRGFQALIDREWIQAGHPFSERHAVSCFNSSKNKQSQPTFLLFLDCVYQLIYQFPTSFEFNVDFLITIFEHSYFSTYGTFLGNSEMNRYELEIKEKTISLWSYLNRPEVMQNYLNALYEPNLNNFWPSVAPVSLELWSELYLRNQKDLSCIQKVSERIRSIIEQDKFLKNEVKKIRSQLTEMTLKQDLENNRL